jgi:hypothetical protein
LGVVVAVALLTIGATASARSIGVTDTVHLHRTGASGSLLYEAGPATGTLPGTVTGQFNVGSRVSLSFTLHTRGGSIKITGLGRPLSFGVRSKFRGSLRVTGGTGRYAHASGHGSFSGVMNRNTGSVTAKVTGVLS